MPQSRSFIGAGDVYVNRVDPSTGLSLGFTGPYEASKFAIKGNSEIKELKSKGRTTYGQVIETVALQQPADLEITLSETGKDGLALALLGTAASLTQGSWSSTTAARRPTCWVTIMK